MNKRDVNGVRRERKITGLHVLLALVGFFGVMLAANGVFVYLALDSFSGLTVDNAYQRGLDYNRELEAVEDQRGLGWTGEAAFESDGAGELDGRVVVRFRDRNGYPLDSLRVNARLLRPTNEGEDRAVELTLRGAGEYWAPVALSRAGQWDLVVEAERSDGARYAMERRLWIK